MSQSEAVNILAVDDVAENLLALEALLQRPDVRVLRACSGREALETLLRESVAVALLDVQMPEIDGFELAALIRGSPRTREIPIIFITGAEQDLHRTFRGYEAGAVDFLHKPIVPEVLRGKVDVFVQLRRQQRLIEQRVAELQEALRLNETFVAALGHDLRTPLQTISNSLEMLKRLNAEGEAQATIQRLQEGARRMSAMIEQLLALARLRSGQFELHRSQVDLGSLARHIVADTSAPDRKITATIRGDTRGFWDETRLWQLMTNLVSNAVKHGDTAAPVTVVIDGSSREEVLCTVANGGAIPNDLLPHIFEPYRSGATETSHLGLGLHIARELTQRHGGELAVTSRPDEGTHFRVRLPRS